MIQLLLIGVVFLMAVFYLGRMVFRSFQSREGCEGDCKCGVAGDSKITKA